MQRADPKHSRLLIENNAGPGGCVGARLEEVRALVDSVPDPRIRVCFDTCHAFAAGYELRTPEGVDATISDLDRVVGLDRVEAIHCNDSSTGLGSNRDRHANIGFGEIGENGFRLLLHDARLQKLPFILEVPGDGHGPDLANMETLRRLAAEPVATANTSQ
jgi:deoxyribonuclease-4